MYADLTHNTPIFHGDGAWVERVEAEPLDLEHEHELKDRGKQLGFAERGPVTQKEKVAEAIAPIVLAS